MGLVRVLLVEDEGLIRLIAEDFLLESGFEVVEAWNGDAAVRILEEMDPFDVLFTDVKMPGIVDGIALAELARRQDPTIAVLVVSGYAENLANRLGILDPPAVFMSKPYELSAIVNALRGLTAKQ